MTACKLSLCYHIEGKIVPIPLYWNLCLGRKKLIAPWVTWWQELLGLQCEVRSEGFHHFC
jgi:hypothetical protein